MSAIEIIKNYLEGNLSSEDFQNELYHNKDVEIVLSEQINIPPYTNCGSAYLYLLEIDLLSPSGEVNGKDLLSQFLKAKGFAFKFNEDHEEIYDLILKVKPSWVNISGDYLKFLCDKFKEIKGRELESLLKCEINSSFNFLKKKPKWLQSPDWPVRNNFPLLFVGQIDISDLKGDASFLYVFFDNKKNQYINIEQSM
ncbi:hypothetical protein [Pectobacterium carotovorum]|uniref:hypothetical protein n=1 Tax=Pectobacterium carotovorum TaxID=554 RepID=UPI00057D2D4F|nr:hypothetical protein [Pectobacterium carotovorum]KHT27165.1 hypothetical protein RC99_19695 [Pectobacterium carotovorum subsp. carotovorum]MBA0179877.1 hypothetical protein [Pectobacterium carotovorum]MBA0194787.1 hypothetical protein [Pectobacterium carotovorum]MBA0203000.1 hypothetical protein [Pectobacterium carotovorum]RJL42647.1 hypothetical protein D5078_17085 [Pectobacterium carotovorum]